MTLEHRIADAESELSDAIHEMAAHGIISDEQAHAMNEDLQAVIDDAEHALGTTIR